MKLPLLGITGCYHLEGHQMLSRSKFPKHPILIKKESLVLFFICPRAMNKKKETFFLLGDTGTVRAILYITFQAIQSFSIFLQTIKDSPM